MQRHDFGERLFLAGEARIQPPETRSVARIHEQAVQAVEEIVPGGSMNGPIGVQGFAMRQNFFPHDVEWRSLRAAAREAL